MKEVIDSRKTLAVAAESTLGRAGYWMMSVTALFFDRGHQRRLTPPVQQMASARRLLALGDRVAAERLPVPGSWRLSHQAAVSFDPASSD